MKFAHRILINQPVSYNLCRSQVLPVPASPVLSSICFLTYAIPRQVSGLLLSVYRLTVFDCLCRCSLLLTGLINSTTVSLFTIASRMGVADKPSQQSRIVVQVFSQHHPADPRHLIGDREHRLMMTAAFRNLARPTAERISFYPSPQRSSILHEHREPAWCADNGCHAWRCQAESVCHRCCAAAGCLLHTSLIRT